MNVLSFVTDLQNLPLWMLVGVAGMLGLVIGSFLNVVIHRLPKILEQQWRSQCAECLDMATSTLDTTPITYNLALPASHCPHCGHPLAVIENIPLLSFLFLRGRCRACGAPISWRYPLIEALAGLGAGVVVWHFGPTWQALAVLGLTWTLIAASAIDLEHHLLPDVLTLPLLWLGLTLSLNEVFVGPAHAIIGAMAGYLTLWSVYWIFRLVTAKEGMGYGDFKLLAALGAWIGWQNLPIVVLLSSLVGAVVGITLIIVGRHDRHQPLPFGPFLAVAGWIGLLWGRDIFQAYLRWSQ